MDSKSGSVWMNRAFELANEALSTNEVPIGCVVVFSSTDSGSCIESIIIGEGRNRTNETKNATLHAEMLAVDQVFAYCEQHGLSAATVMQSSAVYVTVEPCIMCADMLRQLGTGSIVYGCHNERFGGTGSVLNVFQMAEKTFTDSVEETFSQTFVSSGLRKDEAIELLRKFYSGENPSAPEPRQKKRKY